MESGDSKIVAGFVLGAPANKKKKKSNSNRMVQKPLFTIHMPPEMLAKVGVSLSILKYFYLLPSLMHRLESLMLANQLREEISSPADNLHISSALILEAITTLRCCEKFSLERLELLDTCEVPLDSRYETDDASVMVGKPCDNGHMWMFSKTVTNYVEALRGAYYVGGGLSVAFHVMKWLGIPCEFGPSLIDEAINKAFLWCPALKVDEFKMLESKHGYNFSVKGLLLEAITHASAPSQQEVGFGFCYQVWEKTHET